MATIDIAGLPPRDVQEFLATLHNAVDMLDTLAQIQALVGGLAMQGRAYKTEETKVKLERYTAELMARQRKIN